MYFWNKILHVSDISSVHHQEFFTVDAVMVYVIQVCWQLASRIRTELQFRPDPANLYDIYHYCVYSEKLLTMEKVSVRNTYSFIPKINLSNYCIWLFLLWEILTFIRVRFLPSFLPSILPSFLPSFLPTFLRIKTLWENLISDTIW